MPPAAGSAAEPIRRRGHPPFVNRGEELDWLEQGFAAAREGRPRLLLISGEPGVGKSRLLREFLAAPGREAAYVGVGRGYEGGGIAYLPAAEALGAIRARVRVGEIAAPEALALERLISAGPGGQEESPPDESDRLRMFLGVSRALIELARKRPVLIALEDLQWADPASLDLFCHLVFAASDAALQGAARLLFIGTCRADGLRGHAERSIARLQREPITETTELRGLGEDHVARMVEGLGLGRASHQLAETLHRGTAGNPLFVQEVLHRLENESSREGHSLALAEVGEEDLVIPRDLASAISDQIDALGAECREVLAQAALLGAPLDLTVLGEISGHDEDALVTLLEEARAQGLVSADRAGYAFHHDLARAACAARVAGLRREELHARIADALERHYGHEAKAHSGEIARHMLEAGSRAAPERVIAYARAAAEHAASLFAWSEAGRLYAAAARAAARTDASLEERADLHYRAGYFYNHDWDPEPCIEQYDRAIDAYREAGDLRGLVVALCYRTRASFTVGAVAYGAPIDLSPLEACVKALGDEAPILRGRALQTMSEAMWTARDSERALALGERSLALAEEADDDRLRRDAYLALGLANLQVLEVQEALACYEKSLDRARRLDDPWLENPPQQRLTQVLILLGRLADADRLAHDAREQARETHDAGELSLAEANLSVLSCATGAFDEAEEHARRAMTQVDRSRYSWSGVITALALACARAARGESAEALAALDLMVRGGRIYAEPTPVASLFGAVHRELVGALAEPRQPADPDRLADLAKLAELTGSDAWVLSINCALVELADQRGLPGLARSALGPLRLAADRGVVLTTLWVFLVKRILGLAAMLERDWEEADRLFAEALEGARACGARSELARTRADWARMLAARGGAGDRERAKELLAAALEDFRELGMAPHLARASALARELGLAAEAASAPEARAGELTPREQELLRNLSRGRSYEDIGDEFLLSADSVREHADALYAAIDVEGRTDAAGYAIERGLLPDAEVRSTGPIAILVTDLAGFTPLVERLGDLRGRQLIRAHNRILRNRVRRHAGREITHTGDGLIVSFGVVSDAVDCAIAIQRDIAEFNAGGPDAELHVRVGLNAGEPLPEDDRLFGTSVNLASRICSTARPDQILAADVVRYMASGATIDFVDRGRATLKGVSREIQLYEIPWEGPRSGASISRVQPT